MSDPTGEVDIDALWEFGDPAESERRFRAALAALERPAGDGAGDATHRALVLELRTQIARTYSFRRRFEDAHALLDEVERETASLNARRVRVRLLLERGRAFNSAGDPARARQLFIDAWRHASDEDGIGAEGSKGVIDRMRLEGLAVDAAHMVAITHGGTDEAIDWNRRGLELARRSADAKARALIPAMINNAAWDLHALGRLDEALTLFREALDEWSKRQRQPQIRIARWSVARCLRSLGHHEEAIELQQALLAEHDAAGTCDGFVLEEMGELLAALDRVEEARPFFRRAADELANDEHFVKSHPERLAGLRARG